MNTNPDDAKLALWLDDELSGDELAAFEAREVTPELLAAREETRRWRQTLAAAFPASEEPPYPDFFNSRISRSIREEAKPREQAAPARKSAFWSSWLLPAAACAGMAFSFWIGRASGPDASGIVESRPPVSGVLHPLVYTPDMSVKAEWFDSSNASATVIVLQGVNAIPDSMDFADSAYVPIRRESDSTAGREIPLRSIQQ